MKKIVLSLMVILFGSGCATTAPKTPKQPIVRQVTYVNTEGRYQISYPETMELQSEPYGEAAVDKDEYVYLVDKTGTKHSIGLDFILVKPTVYPESKLPQLTKQYLGRQKTKTTAITINNISGWEVRVEQPADDLEQPRRLLYFPDGSYELVLLEYFEPNPIKQNVLNTLQRAK